LDFESKIQKIYNCIKRVNILKKFWNIAEKSFPTINAEEIVDNKRIFDLNHLTKEQFLPVGAVQYYGAGCSCGKSSN